MKTATELAQQIADQELEECLSYASDQGLSTSQMRNHRRPKKPSLKEQVLSLLDQAIAHGDCLKTSDALPAIRRALEALPDD